MLLAPVSLLRASAESSAQDVDNAIYDSQRRRDTDKCECEFLRFEEFIDTGKGLVNVNLCTNQIILVNAKRNNLA